MHQAVKKQRWNTLLISKNSMSSKITQVYTSRGRKKGGLELIPNSEIEKYYFLMCDSQKLEHRKFSMPINGNIEDSQWVPQRDTPCPTDVFITSRKCHFSLFFYLPTMSRSDTGKFLIRLTI